MAVDKEESEAWFAIAEKVRSQVLLTGKMLVEEYVCDPKQVKNLTDPDKVESHQWRDGTIHYFSLDHPGAYVCCTNGLYRVTRSDSGLTSVGELRRASGPTELPGESGNSVIPAAEIFPGSMF